MILFTLKAVTGSPSRHRTSLLAFMICAIALSSLAGSTQAGGGDDWIGLYADPHGENPALQVLPGTPVEAYFVLHAPTYAATGVRVVGFRVDNWPENGPLGSVGVNWGNTLQIGDVANGIAVATIGDYVWQPDENGNVVVGVVTLMSFDASWPGEGVRLECAAWEPYYDLPVISTAEHVEHYIGGDICWMNIYLTPTHDGSFSQLKALY